MIKFDSIERIFAFGCSFTKYHWPTWADVIASEVPNARFYNFGICGAGNLSIASRLLESHQRFQFGKNDLVIAMWSTMCREDRYVTWKEGWQRTGNIFTQNEYDSTFVEKWADPRGYLIRDISIISLTKQYCENLECQHLLLPSVPFDYQQDEKDSSIKEILSLYNSVISKFPRSLLELELKFRFENGHEYYRDGYDGLWQDYHPNTLRYRMYLEKLNIPLTKNSLTFAGTSFSKLKKCNTLSDIDREFNNLINKDSKILF